MNCQRAEGLVPTYMDGELSEAVAGELRRHLMECPACRELAKAETSLKRWFVPGRPVEPPQGFAARVARRAFAGDPGLLADGGTLVPAAPPLVADAEGAGRERLFRFTLHLTAAAALFVILLSIAMQRSTLPDSHRLQAEEDRTLNQLLYERNALEEQELLEQERLEEERRAEDVQAGRAPSR